MVAISIHRGDMHRVGNVPRQWLMPTPTISLKDFKSLLRRRSIALSGIHSAGPTIPNPNPNIKLEPFDYINQQPVDDPEIEVDVKPTVQINSNLKSDSVHEAKIFKSIPGAEEKIINEVSINYKEERKKEVEEKLKILNERKHMLVQMLKQVLTAEEELKRRSSMQGLVLRPSASLYVDVTTDSGSVTRHLTPRMGSDGNLAGDAEGGEVDDASHCNVHPRPFTRTSCISPSSDSPHRRHFHSAVPHASRATSVACASPSRFAPTGQQGATANLPTISVSGMNYMASSPSPAASGGTSIFREGRHTSPWN